MHIICVHRMVLAWFLVAVIFPSRLMAQNAHLLATIAGPKNPLRTVGFDRDGKTVFSGYPDGTIKRWDVATKKNAATFVVRESPVCSFAIGQNGKIMVCGCENGKVEVWDLIALKPIAAFDAHTADVTSVSLSMDGKTLVTGCVDGSVILWDFVRRVQKAELYKGRSFVRSIALNGDGTRVAADDNDTVRVWDTATNKLVAALKNPFLIASMSFGDSVDSLAVGCLDGSMCLWSIDKKREITSIKRHKQDVYAIAMAPNGKIIASAGIQGKIVLNDAASGAELLVLEDDARSIHALSFSVGSDLLVSASSDGSLRVWRIDFSKKKK